MSGHLFILNPRQNVETVIKNKKVQVSMKQWEAGANEIKADDLIYLAESNKGGVTSLCMIAKAATGAVKSARERYIRLSYIRLKSYVLVEGVAVGDSLKETNWKQLDNQEAAACFFDTAVSDRLATSLKSTISKAILKGYGFDTETIYRSVLINGASFGSGPVLRSWYDADLLLNEPKYRETLRKRLSDLDGQTFESLMAVFFGIPIFGFDAVRTTKRSNDDGIDLMATRRDEISGIMLIIGQCKRRKTTINANEVKLLTADRIRSKAARAIFITTSRFSPQAENVAIEDGHVQLMDGDKLAALLFKYAEQMPGLWDKIRQSSQMTLVPQK